jgi:hypothetical protein
MLDTIRVRREYLSLISKALIDRPKGGDMAENPKRDWKPLAQLASVEQDPEKLTEIIHELNDVLLERERQRLGKAQSRGSCS